MQDNFKDLTTWWKNYEESQVEKDSHRQASEFFDEQKYAEAIEILNIILEKYPNNVNLLNKRSEVYCFLGENLEEALSDLNKAIKIEPDAAFFNSRALIYERLQRFDKAIIDHNEAVNQAPDWFQPRFDRAVYFGNNDNIMEALNDINEAIKMKPEAIEAYIFRGDMYSMQNEITMAINDYEFVVNHCNDREIIKECRTKIKELEKIL